MKALTGMRGGNGPRPRILSLPTAALLLFLAFFPQGCEPGKQEHQAGTPRPVPVQVAPVEVSSLEDILTAVGSLSSPQETVVTSQIDGKVTSLHIRQGQVVNRGDVLATLDDSVLQAEVLAAEADLFNVRQIYQRDQKVRDSGGLSEQQLQSDEAAVRQAGARLQQARANLIFTRISAPFTGSLGLRQVSLGSFVKAGNAIVSLHQYDPLHLDFDLPQQEISRLKVGLPAHFSASGLDGEYQGKVTTIDPALAAGSRSVRLQATVANTDRSLKPGMFVRVRLVVGTVPDALFIPAQAVNAEGQVNHVWVVGPDDKAEQREVKVGRYENNRVRIVAGLKPEDRVVVAGIQKLHPGAGLKISPYEPISNPRLDLSPPAQKAPP
jgi:membrane fusion protein (multidrug efflux system)